MRRCPQSEKAGEASEIGRGGGYEFWMVVRHKGEEVGRGRVFGSCGSQATGKGLFFAASSLSDLAPSGGRR